MTKLYNLQITKQFALILASVALEYFQFTLFIVLANQVSADLFPTFSAKSHMIFMATIFMVAGCSRPLGGVIFSGIGDSRYRFKLFYWSTLIMALTSIGLGILPTDQGNHHYAALFLLGLRLCQGLFVGATIPEALIYCYEKAPSNRRVLATTLLNFALSLGFLAAIGYSVVANRYWVGLSWRYGLLLCGGLSLLISFGLKDAFPGEVANDKLSYSNLVVLCREYSNRALILICFATFLTSGIAVFFYVMPSYLHEYFHFPELAIRISSMVVVTSFIAGLVCAVVFHRKVGKNFYISSGFIFKALLVFVFHTYLSRNLFEITLLNSLCTFIFGFFIAKLPVMIISSFPKKIRYAGVSTVYNIGFGLIFAITHYIVLALIHTTRSLYMPSLYIIFFSYISLVSLWFMRKEIFFDYINESI
jgi:MFS family permease